MQQMQCWRMVLAQLALRGKGKEAKRLEVRIQHLLIWSSRQTYYSIQSSHREIEWSNKSSLLKLLKYSSVRRLIEKGKQKRWRRKWAKRLVQESNFEHIKLLNITKFMSLNPKKTNSTDNLVWDTYWFQQTTATKCCQFVQSIPRRQTELIIYGQDE